jgi:hypothetical protein
MPPKYVKPSLLSLSDHPELNERWVHDRLVEDPALLGLGDLVVRDRERPQPSAGRLDLLFQDPDSSHRYEIEVQLGATDESHIIRTLEYWDIERKRYPQYEHTAVIVAERITGRFLNVIGLFNGFIPVVAVQLQALQLGDQVSLLCTTVLCERQLGLVGEDEEVGEKADREYWEKRATKSTLEITDGLFALAREIYPRLSMNYRTSYVGVGRDGIPANFVTFRPKKDWVWLEPRIERDEILSKRLEDSGLELGEYRAKWGRYRIRIGRGDLQKTAPLLKEVLKTAYDQTFD